MSLGVCSDVVDVVVIWLPVTPEVTFLVVSVVVSPVKISVVAVFFYLVATVSTEGIDITVLVSTSFVTSFIKIDMNYRYY